MTAEPPATQAGEPRQARKGATVSRPLRVIGEYLARAGCLGAPGGLDPDGSPARALDFFPASAYHKSDKHVQFQGVPVRLTLSTKYALLALEELARRKGPASAKELAAALVIPSAYLAKLVPLLARAGVLATQRGRGGGVALARPAEAITLKEVIEAVEGPAALQDCPFELSPCPGDPRCPLYPVWDPLRARILDFLAQTTLADVVVRTSPPKEEGA